MTTPNSLTVDADMLAKLEAVLGEPQTFTPLEPEPVADEVETEYHHEPGHDTRDVLATTFLTPVLARE